MNEEYIFYINDIYAEEYAKWYDEQYEQINNNDVENLYNTLSNNN